jgi:hypothetical protein
MSKFYTRQEIKDRQPTKEAVTQARDMVSGYISERELGRNVVIYGSTAWGLHRKFGDQHTRRSDVDVAVSECKEPYGLYSFHLDDDFHSFCQTVERSTGVPVEIANAGREDHTYLINPSTADHFRLLASKFPKATYKEFLGTMQVNFQTRIDDLHNYVWNIREKYLEKVKRKAGTETFDDPEKLKILSSLENFPDHLIRKVLGREKMLPCPDSKESVRRVMNNFPYSWEFKNRLAPFFSEMFAVSQEYESLIDDVGAGLSEAAYKEKFLKMAGKIVESAGEMLEEIPWGLERFLRIARIGKGTPAIILNHYAEGSGGVEAVKLDSDFGNLKEGVEFLSGYVNRETSSYRFRKGDLFKERETVRMPIHSYDRNLRWIKDPIDPERGWFTYKSADGRVHSIKPCSEDLMNRIRQDTDWGLAGIKVRDRKQREYYARFCKEALNPKFSHVPIIRKRA